MWAQGVAQAVCTDGLRPSGRVLLRIQVGTDWASQPLCPRNSLFPAPPLQFSLAGWFSPVSPSGTGVLFSVCQPWRSKTFLPLSPPLQVPLCLLSVAGPNREASWVPANPKSRNSCTCIPLSSFHPHSPTVWPTPSRVLPLHREQDWGQEPRRCTSVR